MARCPKLDHAGSYIGSDKYVCSLTGIEMWDDDPKVKYVCKAEYGYDYEKCPVYQSR